MEWDTKITMDSQGGYSLSYERDGFIGTSPEVSADSSLEYLISGLSQGITYYVRISTKNTLGYGPSSPVVYARPMQSPSVPTMVQLKHRASYTTAADLGTSLDVKWSMPTNFGGSEITKYRVEWAKSDFELITVEEQTVSTVLADGALSGVFTLTLDTSTCITCNVRGTYTSAYIHVY